MSSLDNLLIIGVRKNPDLRFIDLEKGITHYSLNLWRAHHPYEPQVVPVPYRGGFFGGFNDLKALDKYLLIVDGESILAYHLTDLNKGYAEFMGVEEVSESACETHNHMVSCLDNFIQIRSLDDITSVLQQAAFSNEHVEVPYRQIQHRGRGDTVLSMMAIENGSSEFALLNDAEDQSYLIFPSSGRAHSVEFLTKQEFPHTFQRREQFHFIPEDQSKYLIFTESTSDNRHRNRVYSFNIRGPPTITELEPLQLPETQIESMLLDEGNHLNLLSNQEGISFLQRLDPIRREIISSRPLARTYEPGDRLQEVGGQLLIVRHLENEVVDAETEDSVMLTGAENDIPIQEISSTWNVPQYLYVARYPPNDKEIKNKDIDKRGA